MSKVVSAIIFMLTMLEELFSRHGKSTSFHIHFGLCFGPCFDPSAPVSQHGIHYRDHNYKPWVFLFIYVRQGIAQARETLTRHRVPRLGSLVEVSPA